MSEKAKKAVLWPRCLRRVSRHCRYSKSSMASTLSRVTYLHAECACRVLAPTAWSATMQAWHCQPPLSHATTPLASHLLAAPYMLSLTAMS